MEQVIHLEHLRKVYGNTVAVDDISFSVNKGEIFGIVGPNGSGKTTTVESVIGLRKPDQGKITVLGLNPQADSKALGNRIGIQLQHAAIPSRMKVWEALDLYASFYERTIPWEPLLETWGLRDKRNAQFDSLSGGQKQRLFIALALINDPEIVFLDELTTGLDPAARRATWDLVNEIREQGKTVVLITHYMDEIETLANRVAIIDQGRVLALDTPANLIANLNAETQIRFTAPSDFVAEPLASISGVTSVSRERNLILVNGNGSLLAKVAVALEERGMSPADLQVHRASLEDVFLAMTGRKVRE